MAYKKIEIQDYAGIKLYPKTTADIVVTSNGETLESIAAKANGASNPNLLINGGFNICQELPGPYTATTTPTYTVDQWVLQCSASGNGVMTRLDAGQGIQFSGSSTHIMQPVAKGDILIPGASYTFSVTALAANANNSNKILMGIGLKNSLNGAWIKSITQEYPLTGAQGRYALTIDGIDSYEASYLVVDIYVSGAAIIRNAKLEQGNVATPFVPEDYTLELLRCMRHYRRPKITVTTLPRIADNLYLLLDHWYNVPMRIDPTVTLYEPGNIYGPGNPEGYKFGDEGWGAANHIWVKGNTDRTGYKRVNSIGANEEKIDVFLLADASSVAGNSYYCYYEADARIR